MPKKIFIDPIGVTIVDRGYRATMEGDPKPVFGPTAFDALGRLVLERQDVLGLKVLVNSTPKVTPQNSESPLSEKDFDNALFRKR